MTPGKVLACRSCGAVGSIQSGADLICGPECAADYATAGTEAVAALTQEGFSRDTTTPNLFWKDGVAVSLEQVVHEGFEKSVAAHQRSVAARA